MKISDIIDQLREVEKIHGNVDVYVKVTREAITGEDQEDWVACEVFLGLINELSNCEVPCAKVRPV